MRRSKSGELTLMTQVLKKAATALRLLVSPARFVEVILEKYRARILQWLLFYGPRAARIRRRHFTRLGWGPNIKNPTSYTDKVQWRKLYCPQIELFAVLADKVGALPYVAERIGTEHILNPTWIGSYIDEPIVRSLGDGVVIKPTHRSGQVAIIERQEDVNAAAIAEHMARSLRWPYSMASEEPWYGWQQPQIVAQPLILSPEGNKYIQDIKFHIFRRAEGQPKVVCEVINTTPHWRVIFDENFQRLPFEWSPSDYPPPSVVPERPERFEEMLRDAIALADGIDYVRVDFLLGSDNYYFPELTFGPVGGRPLMDPPEWDEIVGGWWDLDVGDVWQRAMWRARAWWPMWATEMPIRLVRRLALHEDDIFLPALQHEQYLKDKS